MLSTHWFLDLPQVDSNFRVEYAGPRIDRASDQVTRGRLVSLEGFNKQDEGLFRKSNWFQSTGSNQLIKGAMSRLLMLWYKNTSKSFLCIVKSFLCIVKSFLCIVSFFSFLLVSLLILIL